MEKLIKLNDTQKEQFSKFIKSTRNKIIPKPKDILIKTLLKHDLKTIKLDTISQTITQLREYSYDEFLTYENEFNSVILKNIASKFNIADEILTLIAKDFFKNLPSDYDSFKASFSLYFGRYAGEISPYIYELCLSNTHRTILTSQTNEVRLCDQSLALWKRTKAPLRGVPHLWGFSVWFFRGDLLPR
ncbi:MULTISPECIES: hypothetical protein [Campylobacter]|uniref:hypothetical protein n=1 Tax=Campylobacter TaxID=194 RepID=UPI000A359915|nr:MULTISPECIES: hypothetical protein [unclassified Campylobacter]MCR8679617.1 hypothetical protein [Campylobacter sp. RM19072]